MRDGVKRCREVQEDEDAEAARVPQHRSTALDIAAIFLKEGQLGRIVVASL